MSTLDLAEEQMAFDDPMIPTWFRVQRVRRETHDTFTLDLACRCDGSEFSFAPGQFNMLYVFGVGEVPISISGDADTKGSVVHTIRAVGAVTRAMQKLKRNDLIGVRGPFGTAWPVTEAVGRDIVIVTGGIGLAPLRSAYYHFLAHRDNYNRIVLLYGARTRDDILYRDELKQWRGELDLEVDVSVDRSVGRWRGNVGVVTKLIPRAEFEPRNTIALICGPEVMMRFTVQALVNRGVATQNIYVSMERNMKCAVGFCGHCQYGPKFICKDGPVFRFSEIEDIFGIREL
jgi:NAD(P)H-flavin reductase